MQLEEIIIFSLKHVIVRPTKIVKSQCINAYLCAGFTEVLNNCGRSNDESEKMMISYAWFHAQLAQKILNRI